LFSGRRLRYGWKKVLILKIMRSFCTNDLQSNYSAGWNTDYCERRPEQKEYAKGENGIK
jgi:hypothetical protein